MSVLVGGLNVFQNCGRVSPKSLREGVGLFSSGRCDEKDLRGLMSRTVCDSSL